MATLFRLLILFALIDSAIAKNSSLPECRPHNLKLASPSKGKWYLLPDGSMRFENDRCELRRFEYSDVASCMKKSHLVMMGASVSRYMYLTLISLLTHGQWPQKFSNQHHPELPPSIIWERDFKDFFSFFEATNQGVTKAPSSFEICDCYRHTYAPWASILAEMNEARYYRHIPNGDLNDHENDIRISFLVFNGLIEVPVRGHKELAFYPRDESFKDYVNSINQRYCKDNTTYETLIPYMQACGKRRLDNKNNQETWDFPSFSEVTLPDCDKIYEQPDTNQCQAFEREIFQGLNATHVMINMGWHRSLRAQHPLFLEKLVDAGRKYLKPLNSTSLKLGKVIWRSCTFDEKFEEGEELVHEYRHREGVRQEDFEFFNVYQLTARLKQYSKARKEAGGAVNVLDYFNPHPSLFPKELISKIESKEITFVSPSMDGIHLVQEYSLMMKSSLLLALHFILMMIFAVHSQESATPCCLSCTVPGQEKFYSIDTRHNSCGECCMDPADYDLYKKYEPGLEKANSSTPCLDLKYPTYTETVTHGFGNVKMTLDLYDPESKK